MPLLSAGKAVRLRPNPQVHLTLIKSDGALSAVRVRAPVRGEGLREGKITRSEDPEIFALLLILGVSHARGTELPEVSGAALERLVEIGYLVSEEQVSRPVRFGCEPADPPSDLVSRRLGGAAAEEPLIVNPTLRHLGRPAPDWPIPNKADDAASFFEPAEWVLVSDQVVMNPIVYSLDERWSATLGSLEPGKAPPSPLGPEEREWLAGAKILVAPGSVAASGTAGSVAAAREQLSAEGYAMVPDVLDRRNLAALRRYYRQLIEEGYLQFGDEQWPQRYFSYGEAVTSLFHWGFTDLLSSLAGEPLKPSFSYVASYRAGSELPPHCDRAQCEYSVSVLLDYDPEPDGASPWPLFVKRSDSQAEPVPIKLAIGDCAIYRGREILHYRERLAESHSATYWFLFYVPESFSGPLD